MNKMKEAETLKALLDLCRPGFDAGGKTIAEALSLQGISMEEASTIVNHMTVSECGGTVRDGCL